MNTVAVIALFLALEYIACAGLWSLLRANHTPSGVPRLPREAKRAGHLIPRSRHGRRRA